MRDGQGDTGGGVIGLYGQLTPAPIDQHRQTNLLGAAIVEQLVEYGAHGAPREEHVVEQNHLRAIDRERQARLYAAGHAALRKIVAVQGRRDDPAFTGQAQVGMQALGQPDPARGDAHQLRLGADQRAQATPQFSVQGFGVEGQSASVHGML